MPGSKTGKTSRSEDVKFRVSPEEKAILQKRMTQMGCNTLTELCRDVWCYPGNYGLNPDLSPGKQVDSQTQGAIHTIGLYMGALARHADLIEDKEIAQEVLDTLLRIEEHLNQVDGHAH